MAAAAAFVVAFFCLGYFAAQHGWLFVRAAEAPAVQSLSSEQIQLLHANCEMHLSDEFSREMPIQASHHATWVCDEIFWDYFCDLYPLNKVKCS